MPSDAGFADAVVALLTDPSRRAALSASGLTRAREFSLARMIDAYEDVRSLLTEHRDKLESLTAALLEHETLDEPEAYEAAGVPRPPAEEDDDPTRGEIVLRADAGEDTIYEPDPCRRCRDE